MVSRDPKSWVYPNLLLNGGQGGTRSSVGRIAVEGSQSHFLTASLVGGFTTCVHVGCSKADTNHGRTKVVQDPWPTSLPELTFWLFNVGRCAVEHRCLSRRENESRIQ